MLHFKYSAKPSVRPIEMVLADKAGDAVRYGGRGSVPKNVFLFPIG